MATPVPPAAFDPNKLYVWVKALEGKVNNLMREVEVLKSDLVKRQGQLGKDVKTVNDDLLDFKHQQEQLLQRMDLVIHELTQTAGIEEVQVLKKYVEYWNPLMFVTQRDVDRILESKLALRDAKTQNINRESSLSLKKGE